MSEEKSTKTFFLVENLSDPESAFRIEQIYHAAGFEGALDQSTSWEGSNLYYYAAIEVSAKLYRRLRQDKLDNDEAYVTSGYVAEESPESLIKRAASAAWAEWVVEPMGRLWEAVVPS